MRAPDGGDDPTLARPFRTNSCLSTGAQDGLVLALRRMSDSTEQLHPDIESVLYDEDVLRSKCAELGAAIATDYKDLSPLLMVTITGAYMFASDLAKVITPVPRGMQIDFIRASSYGSGTVSSGDVRIQVRQMSAVVHEPISTRISPCRESARLLFSGYLHETLFTRRGNAELYRRGASGTT